ncbi:hypothetical protein HDU76_006912 [Blyttiomyces sp. JEL0837]|nr:hypothetical protein HDU76_006912 [Blyttiomyces sp. JEL0837]
MDRRALFILASHFNHTDLARYLLNEYNYDNEAIKLFLDKILFCCWEEAFDREHVDMLKVLVSTCVNTVEWRIREFCSIVDVTSKLNNTWKVDGILYGIEYENTGVIAIIEMLETGEREGACEAALNVAVGVGGNVLCMNNGAFLYNKMSAGKVWALFESVGVDVSGKQNNGGFVIK